MHEVETRWSEIVKILTERYPGKAYGSYLQPSHICKL